MGGTEHTQTAAHIQIHIHNNTAKRKIIPILICDTDKH